MFVAAQNNFIYDIIMGSQFNLEFLKTLIYIEIPIFFKVKGVSKVILVFYLILYHYHQSHCTHFTTQLTAHGTHCNLSNTNTITWAVIKHTATHSSETECPLMVPWITGLIPLSGLTEPFLIIASAPQLVQQKLRFIVSCLWDGAQKRSLAANWK